MKKYYENILKNINKNKKMEMVMISNDLITENTIIEEKNFKAYIFKSIEDFEKNNKKINDCDVIIFNSDYLYNEDELNTIKKYALNISNNNNKLVTIGYHYLIKNRTREIQRIYLKNNNEHIEYSSPSTLFSILNLIESTIDNHYETIEESNKNKPKKININELILENIDESNAIFKDELRKKKLVPILNGEVINTYEVQTTDKTYELISKYIEELSNITKTVTNDEHMINDMRFKSSKYNNFCKIKISTKEDIINYFNIKNEDDLKSFLALKQNRIYKHDGMTYNEIIDAITKYYYCIYFRYMPKLSQILESLNELVDIDYLAEQTYNFLYNKNITFRTGMNYTVEEFNTDKFNYTEMNLPFDEKINICKEIIDSLNISCVHTFKPNELNNFLLSNIYHTKDINELIEFAKHNSEIIHIEEFKILFENKKNKQKRI